MATIYKVTYIEDGRSERERVVRSTWNNLEDAKEELANEMAAYGHDDYTFLRNAEDIEAEIESAAEMGDDDEEGIEELRERYIAQLKEATTPCLVLNPRYGEDIIALQCDGTWFRYDNRCYEIIEEEALTDKETRAIEKHLEKMDDEGYPEATRLIAQTDEALLVEFEFEDGKNAAIYYPADDVLFTTDDWQGEMPESVEDIERFNWRTSDGRKGIIINGWPLIL